MSRAVWGGARTSALSPLAHAATRPTRAAAPCAARRLPGKADSEARAGPASHLESFAPFAPGRRVAMHCHVLRGSQPRESGLLERSSLLEQLSLLEQSGLLWRTAARADARLGSLDSQLQPRWLQPAIALDTRHGHGARLRTCPSRRGSRPDSEPGGWPAADSEPPVAGGRLGASCWPARQSERSGWPGSQSESFRVSPSQSGNSGWPARQSESVGAPRSGRPPVTVRAAPPGRSGPWCCVGRPSGLAVAYFDAGPGAGRHVNASALLGCPRLLLLLLLLLLIYN